MQNLLDHRNDGASLGSENDALKEKIIELKDQVALLKMDLDALRAENADLKKKNEALLRENNALKDEIAELKKGVYIHVCLPLCSIWSLSLCVSISLLFSDTQRLHATCRSPTLRHSLQPSERNLRARTMMARLQIFRHRWGTFTSNSHPSYHMLVKISLSVGVLSAECLAFCMTTSVSFMRLQIAALKKQLAAAKAQILQLEADLSESKLKECVELKAHIQKEEEVIQFTKREHKKMQRSAPKPVPSPPATAQ